MRALDKNGNLVKFFNEQLSGYLVSHHTMLDGTVDTDQDYNCEVDSHACNAVRFELGGTGLILNQA